MTCSAVDALGNHCALDHGHKGCHLRRAAHTCHATGCAVVVPPKLLMCLRHWRMVPRALQARIWATYRPGQEIAKNPSPEYLVAQEAAVAAVAVKEGHAE